MMPAVRNPQRSRWNIPPTKPPATHTRSSGFFINRSATISPAQSQAWLAAMQVSFPDVKSGDRLTGLTPGLNLLQRLEIVQHFTCITFTPAEGFPLQDGLAGLGQGQAIALDARGKMRGLHTSA